jgi:Protein of unknown function (DUF998)
METSLDLPDSLLKVLLACGLIAALLYVGTDILAGLLKPGYRFDSQSAGVLRAVGTPTRSYVLPLNLLACILMIAFAVGIWFSAGQNWLLRVMACLLSGNAALTIVAVAFFPLHLDQPFNTNPNKIYVILMMIGVILFVLAIGFGAAANQNWFRYFSIGLILLFLGAYVFSTRGTAPVLFGEPGPAVGIQERSMFYCELLWLALQAIILLRV